MEGDAGVSAADEGGGAAPPPPAAAPRPPAAAQRPLAEAGGLRQEAACGEQGAAVEEPGAPEEPSGDAAEPPPGAVAAPLALVQQLVPASPRGWLPEPSLGSAAVAERLVRLERRLEIERKQLQRQLQRMERRMQDLLQAPAPNVGRWAELQGYVDGLAETVQGLLSKREASGPVSPLRGADDELSRGEVRAVAARMDAMTEDLAALAARVLEAEQGLAGLAEAELDGRLADLEDGLGTRIQDLERSRGDWASFARGSALEGQPSRQVAELCEQVAELRGRMRSMDRRAGCAAAAQLAAYDAHALREEMGELREEVSALRAGAWREPRGEEAGDLRAELEGQLAQLREEVASLGAWALDADCELRNQDTRQRVGRVGEQVLRLSCAGGAESAAAAAAEMRGVREDVGQLGEQLAGLHDRMLDAESGIKDVGQLGEQLAGLHDRMLDAESGIKDVTQLGEQLAGIRDRTRSAESGLQELEAGRRLDAGRLEELEARLQLLREDAERSVGLSLEARVAEQSLAAEARLQRLEVRVEGLAAPEDFTEPSAVQAGQRGVLSLEQHLVDARDLEELRSLVEEMREQQAELAVGLGLRAQEEGRSREALAGVQDLRCEVEHLGRQLQEHETRAREAKRGLDELSGEVRAMGAGASPAAAAVEARLSELEGRLAEASELASAARCAPALEARLRELEQGREEASELTSAALSLPALEARLRELERGLVEASELASAARSLLALEARLRELEQGLAEARQLSLESSSRPALEERVLELEEGQAEARELSGAARALPALTARLEELEEASAEASELSVAARALPALAARLEGLEDGLAEATEFSAASRAVPVLAARLEELEDNLAEARELANPASHVPALEGRLLELERDLVEARELSGRASAVAALEERVLKMEEALAEAIKGCDGASSACDLDGRLRELEHILPEAKDVRTAVESLPALEAQLRDLLHDLPEAKDVRTAVESLPGLEAQLRDLQHLLPEAKTLCTAAEAVPAVEARLREMEDSLAEAKGLSMTASSVTALEQQVQELQQGFAQAKELSAAAARLPALEPQLRELREGVLEAKELSGVAASVPSLEAQVKELEQRLEQESAARRDALEHVRSLADATDSLRGQHAEVREGLGARVCKLEERATDPLELEALRDGAEAAAKKQLDLETALRKAEVGLEEANSRLNSLADSCDSADAIEQVRGQHAEICGQLDARVRKLEETAADASDVAALRGEAESVSQRQRGTEDDLRRARSSLEELASHFSGLAKEQEDLQEAVGRVRSLQAEGSEELGTRLRKLEEAAAGPGGAAAAVEQASSVSKAQARMEAGLQEVAAGLEEQRRQVESLCKKHADEMSLLLQAQEQGQTCSSRLAALEGVVSPISSQVLMLQKQTEELTRHVETLIKKHADEMSGLLQAQEQGQSCISRLASLEGEVSPISSQVLMLQKQTEELQASMGRARAEEGEARADWESRLSSAERAAGAAAGSEELRSQLEALGLGHSELEAGLREARNALEELAASPAASEAALAGVHSASLAFQRAHTEQSVRLGQRLAQVEQRLPEAGDLSALPGQLERLGLQHEEAQESLREARESVELLARKVNDLTGSDCRAGAQEPQERSPGKGSSRCDPEQMRDVCEQLGLLRGEVCQLRDREEYCPGAEMLAEDQEPLELRQAVEWLRRRQAELGASCEERLREVERGVHDSAGMRELRRQVQELAATTGRAREQQLLQEEQANALGLRLREAERRLGEAVRGQLDRAWWEHAEELATGLARAEERGLRQASSLEDLAGQLSAACEQIDGLRTQLRELTPADTTSVEANKLGTSPHQVYVQQAGLNTRPEAARGPGGGEELGERLEELGRRQAELGERLAEVVHDVLGPRLDTVEQCLEGLMGGQLAAAQAGAAAEQRPGGGGPAARAEGGSRAEATSGSSQRLEEHAGEEAPWRPPFAAGSQSSPPRSQRERPAGAGHESAADGSAQYNGRAAPYTPRDGRARGSREQPASLAQPEPEDPGRRRSASADAGADALGKSGLERARAQAQQRLLSATVRLQAQSARSTLSTTDPSACAGSSTSPPLGSSQLSIARAEASTWPSLGGGSSSTDVEHISKELARRARLEAHRAEALGAVEARVAAVAEQLGDLCARLDEAENGLDAAGRGGVALRLRFEQLQSLLDARLHALSSELAEVSARQLAAERSLADMASEGVRARYEAQLRPLPQGSSRSHELQAVADRFHQRR